MDGRGKADIRVDGGEGLAENGWYENGISYLMFCVCVWLVRLLDFSDALQDIQPKEEDSTPSVSQAKKLSKIFDSRAPV